MKSRRIRWFAFLLAGISVGEMTLAVLTLGHRHDAGHRHSVPGTLEVAHVHSCGHHIGPAASHVHGHRHSGSDAGFETARFETACTETSAGSATPGSATTNGTPGSSPAGSHGSHDDCSICRHLAQPVLAVVWTVEQADEAVVDEVVQHRIYDVVAPAYLFRQPRSPPAAV